MPIRTKRWNDPVDPDDGYRLLITRYRPRGVSKAQETWDAWDPSLGPDRALLARFKTDTASPIAWSSYQRHYLQQQKRNQARIDELAGRARSGETITLLCASSCLRESRCHRSLLKMLIEQAMRRLG